MTIEPTDVYVYYAAVISRQLKLYGFDLSSNSVPLNPCVLQKDRNTTQLYFLKHKCVLENTNCNFFNYKRFSRNSMAVKFLV